MSFSLDINKMKSLHKHDTIVNKSLVQLIFKAQLNWVDERMQ